MTSIGAHAFEGCESLTEVTLSNGITSISDYLFHACESLTSIIIPDGVTSIGKGAFLECKSLTSVIIPDRVISIGEGAFRSCESLVNITIPASVTSIGYTAFRNCYSLTSITVNSANTSYLSDECGVLFNKSKSELIQYPVGNTRTNYNIPNCVTTIDDYAFLGCESLTSIAIPNGVTSIGDYAFRGCKSLISIAIPIGVKNISKCVFRDCIKLTEVTIPHGVINIGEYAFENCRSLTSITIPDSVTSIGGDAFYNCENLTSLTIPDTVTIIGNSAFRDCKKLVNVTIPDTVTSIGNYVFSGCEELTNIILPNSLTSIGNSAFRGCRSLTSITIPDSVTSIDYYAFYDCARLEYLHIPKYVTNIGGKIINSSAFYICSDTEDCYAKEYAVANGYEFILCDGSHTSEGGENETPDKLELVSTYPLNAATSVSYDDELVMTFNQNLSNDLLVLDSESAIKICDYNTDQEIYRIDIDDYGAIGFDDSPIVIEGNELTIRNALHKLVPGSKYYVSISPNIIIAEDYTTDSNKGFAGITDKDTWTFSYLSPSVKERYSLDVYFNEPTVSLSAGESASISAVLSFNGATTFPEITFSIDDTTVAEITEIKTESDITYTKIRGNNQGSATITVTANTINGNIVKKFPVFVSDPETVYYCNYIDGRFDDNNPFYVSGMYIDNFKHIENSDGSVTADFDVYNGNHSIGVVEIYDENGTIKDVEIIDMFDSDYPSDIFSHAGYAYKLVEGMATGELFDSDMYTSGIWHQKTRISITIPQNGYYLITNNISVSDYCLIYNMTLLAVESAFKVTDSIMDATAVSKEISKTISNEIPTIGDAAFKALKKLAKSIIKGWSEDLAETSVGIEKVFDDFYDFINTCGLDFAKLLVDSVKKVAPEAANALVLEKLYDVTLDKCGAKIVDNIFYKPVEVAKWGAVFASISENSYSSSVYIYNQQNNSMRKSNGIVSHTTENYDTVFHTVILKSGDKVDYVNRLTGEQEKAKVYDISLIRDGESVQPKGSVTVYIPIPNGWNTDNLTLYHISKETGKREKIPVEVENGYAKFVTDSFSYFILSTDELKFVDTFGIKTPSTTTISYGDTLILHADIESVPNGTNIVWEISGNGVSIKPSEDGLSCAVTSTKTGTVLINAKLVDESGEVLKNFDGEELTASQSIKSNAGFFQKIIAFFKKLFGLTKTIPQIYKGIF